VASSRIRKRPEILYQAWDNDCDGIGMTTMFRKILDRGEAGDNVGLLHGAKGSQTVVLSSSPPAKITRLTTAHGQSFTWSHDAQGSVLSHTTPVPGQGFSASYDNLGRCVSRTILDGDGPGFRTDVHYAASNGFLQSVVIDPDGLALTEAQDCDDLGRTTRYTDPRGHQWLVEYNALDLPTRIDSPPAQGGQSIATRFYYDGGGNFFCGKTDHFRSDGSPVQGNADYATVVVRDSRGRVTRIAEEIFPVDYDPAAGTDLADLGLENFAVIDITYGPDGRCSRLSVPAASRQSTEDAVCDFTYDERGLVHRVIAPGVSGVTHEYHYTSAGQVSSRVIVAPGQPSPAVHFAYDGFHRISSFTDAMGNQAAFDYSSRGHVTASVFGEITDVPGGAGNVLLERTRLRFGQSPTVPGSVARRERTAVIGFACTSGAGSAAARSNKMGPILHVALGASLASGPTGDCDDSDPLFDALSLPGVSEVCYSIDVKVSPSSAGRSASGSILDELDDSDGPVIVALQLPGVEDACYSINKKARSPRLTDSLFHGWFVASDTLEAERFAAGAPAPHPVEVTTLTRSPAGLPVHLSRNGDSLATCDHDTAGRLSSVTNAACRVDVVRDASGNITSSTRSDYSTVAGTPAKTFTVTRIIDALGRTSSLADGGGSSVSFGYDSLHRMTSFTDPVSGVLTAEYDGTSADGLFSVRYHKDMDGDGIPDFLGAVTTPALNGRTCTCPLGYRSSSSTDSLGRTTRRDHADGTFETLAYDARGFLTEILHRDGTLTTFTHDLNGRVVSESITGGPAGLPTSPDRFFTYDGRGFVRSIGEGTTVCAWTHDSLGNVLTETQSGESITHTYDHRGRTGYATSVQWPYQLSIVETRDAFGRVTTVTARDDAGQLVSPPVASMQHLGMRVSRCDTANGVSTIHTYRGDGDPALPDTSNFGFDRCVLTESSHQGTAIFISKKGYDYYQSQSSLKLIHRDGSSPQHPARARSARAHHFQPDRLRCRRWHPANRV
jgi:YD repeat-containing protein